MQSPPPNRLRKIRTWQHGNGNAELKATDDFDQSPSLLDLASNDYLGLSKHPKLIEAAKESIFIDGVGSGGSRLVTGSRPIHNKLEEALSEWLERESILLFPSGFQANLAAVLALANRKTPIIADRLIHHSLLVGIKASGGTLQRYEHNNLKDLDKKLLKAKRLFPNYDPLVITESLFSMEGSNAPIKEIVQLCCHHKAKLIVDEAHSIGIMGSEGKGICYGISAPQIIVSGTFGKAFGSGGAFLACDKVMGEYLLQSSGAFRYTTALAPPLAAAALAALRLIQNHPQWGQELQTRSRNWRAELESHGWQRPVGLGPIMPLILGEDEKALRLQAQLEINGMLAIAIRPPTVPEGTSRLRLVLRRDLPNGTLLKLLNALK